MVTFEVLPSDAPAAEEALRGFFASVGAIFFERDLGEDEITRIMQENRSPDLDPPNGLLVVAMDGDAMLGCGGLHWLNSVPGKPMAEVKHLHVSYQARGRGLGEAIMRDLEGRAHGAGCVALRLDTRSNLWAARRLYDRLGFVEIPRYSDNPLAQNWYEKPLR